MPNLGSLNSAEIKGDEGKTRMAVVLIDGLSISAGLSMSFEVKDV